MTLKTVGVFLGALLVTGALSLGTTVIEGDVYIELMASVYNNIHENGTCYNVSSESVQNIEAILWILTQLNAQGYFTWGKQGIGLRVSSTCNSKVRAEKLAYDLSVSLNDSSQGLVGLLGPEYSSEAETVSRLLSALTEKYRLLQISYTATSASLRNREIYKNFFRTIPPDDVQAQVMTEFAIALNWTYMAIIYDDDAYGRGGKDELVNNMSSRDICYPTLIPVALNTSYTIENLQHEIRSRIINASVPVGGAIVFGSSTLASTVLAATESVMVEFPNITYPTFLFSEAGGYLEGQGHSVSKGVFVLSPHKKIVKAFQTHWRSLFTSVENIYNLQDDYRDWMMDVYKEQFGCTLAGNVQDNNCSTVSSPDVIESIRQSVYNQYAIQASLTMAKVANNVHDNKCRSAVLCAEFFSANRNDFVDAAQNISIDFDNDFGGVRIQEFKNPDLVLNFTSEGEVVVPNKFPSYEIYNRQLCASEKFCLVKVAYANQTKGRGIHVIEDQIRDYDFDGNELIWPHIRKPQCPDMHQCASCLSKVAPETDVYFQRGDVYVVCVVAVHHTGTTPFECGELKNGGVDIVEAIRFAVSEAQYSYSDKIPKGQIGIIVIDSCNDPHILQEKMLILLRNGVLKDGVYVPVADKIIGYVGGWSSSVSTVMADITSRSGNVQISYASTASILSDTHRFPYFMRTPTSDNFQGKTMIKVVKTFKSNLIQIVFTEGTYGEGGRDNLVNLAAAHNICIAGIHPLSATTNISQLVQSLRTFASAKVVLLFINSFYSFDLVENLNGLLDESEFIFIASEGWGTRVDIKNLVNLLDNGVFGTTYQ